MSDVREHIHQEMTTGRMLCSAAKWLQLAHLDFLGRKMAILRVVQLTSSGQLTSETRYFQGFELGWGVQLAIIVR